MTPNQVIEIERDIRARMSAIMTRSSAPPVGRVAPDPPPLSPITEPTPDATTTVAVAAKRRTITRGAVLRVLGWAIVIAAVATWAALVRPADVGGAAYAVITIYLGSVVTMMVLLTGPTRLPLDSPDQPPALELSPLDATSLVPTDVSSIDGSSTDGSSTDGSSTEVDHAVRCDTDPATSMVNFTCPCGATISGRGVAMVPIVEASAHWHLLTHLREESE